MVKHLSLRGNKSATELRVMKLLPPCILQTPEAGLMFGILSLR